LRAVALALVLFASGVRIEGRLDPQWTARSEAIADAWRLLDRAPAVGDSSGSGDFLTARASLALRAEGDLWAASLGVEHLPRRRGEWRRIGEDPGPFLREAWIEYRPWNLRVGAQPYTFQLRPPGVGEPLYLAPSESGSAWRPFVRAAGTSDRADAIRAGNDADFLTPAGVRLRRDWNPFVMTEAFAFRVARDEYLAGVLANGAALDRAAAFLLATYGTGPFAGSRLWTFGAGADVYLGPDRATELFLEIYFQTGVLTDRADRRIRKGRAWAVQAGARRWFGSFWIEAAHRAITGDRSPNDDHDTAFQSYGNVRQFLVAEDATFGIGLENGYRVWALSAGWGRAPDQSRFFVRADAGFFDLEHPLRDRTGAVLTRRNSLGVETDVTVHWRVHERAALVARAGWLWNSAALEDLTGRRDDGVIVVGPEIRF
jgi:hypothetical protein